MDEMNLHKSMTWTSTHLWDELAQINEMNYKNKWDELAQLYNMN